jgi:hypothetical protein
MNRIIERLGVLALFVTLSATGCAVASTSGSEEEEVAQESADYVTDGDEFVSRGKGSVVKYRATSQAHSACAGCGPLPEPWQMGPLPEPWTEPKTSSSSSSSGGSSSGSNSSSSGGK